MPRFSVLNPRGLSATISPSMKDKILILDFGSQYTQLIARRVRELGVFSEIQPYNYSLKKIMAAPPAGIILSGGPASITGAGAPRVDRELFQPGHPHPGHLLRHAADHPDCWAAGWNARPGANTAKPSCVITAASPLFRKVKDAQHGLDEPRRFGRPPWPRATRSSPVPATAPSPPSRTAKQNIFAVQFHPEVVHSQEGKKILANFLFTIAGAARTWSMKNFVANEIAQLREQCLDKRVVLGVSGGVDSTTLAVLLRKALGEKVTSIFVNNGLLRLNEEKEVLDNLRRRLGLKVTYIDASRTFPEKPEGRRLPGNESARSSARPSSTSFTTACPISISWSRARCIPT